MPRVTVTIQITTDDPETLRALVEFLVGLEKTPPPETVPLPGDLCQCETPEPARGREWACRKCWKPIGANRS